MVTSLITLVLYITLVDSITIDDSCLHNLCHFTTACDANLGCKGRGSAHCGPYQISVNFWKEAGSPGNSFVSCAGDMICSQLAVSRYMNRYARDCNQDSVINCMDYAALLKAGPLHCHQKWVYKTPFLLNVKEVLDSSKTSLLMNNSSSRSFGLHGNSKLEDDDPFDDLYPTNYGASDSLRLDTGNRDNVIYIPRHGLPDLRRRLEGTPWVISSWGEGIDNSRGTPRSRTSTTTRAPSHDSRRRRVKTTYTPSNPTTKPPVIVSFPTRSNRRTPGSRRRTTANDATTTPRSHPPTTRPVRRTRTTVTTMTPRRRATVIWRDPDTTLSTTARPRTTSSRFTTTRRVTTTTPLSTTRFESREVPFATSTRRPTTTINRDHRPRYPTAKPTFNPRKITKATDSDPYYSSTTESNEVVPSVNEKNGTTEIGLTDNCLECICHGSSGCNFDITYKCYGEDECGPYKIDYAYWYDAGYPGYKGNNDDFHKCAKDRTCAEKTVRQYIAINAMDCNKDGTIDCMDYAALHKAGPEYCNSNWVYESKFWNSFSECAGFDEKAMYQNSR